jgi:hypothetical protein
MPPRRQQQRWAKIAETRADGLIALFGYPAPQENDSERAVRRFSISFAHSSQSNGGLVFVASYAEFLERTRVPFSTTEIKNLDNVPIANPINMLRRYGSRKLLMGM